MTIGTDARKLINELADQKTTRMRPVAQPTGTESARFATGHNGDKTMSTFRKILVPTDFSPHAQEAFRVAHDLAKATGAIVVVFHVFRSTGYGIGWRPAALGRGRGETKDVWEELRKIQAKDSAVHVEHDLIMADRPDAEHIIRIIQEAGMRPDRDGDARADGAEAPAVRQRDRGRGAEGPLSCDGR